MQRAFACTCGVRIFFWARHENGWAVHGTWRGRHGGMAIRLVCTARSEPHTRAGRRHAPAVVRCVVPADGGGVGCRGRRASCIAAVGSGRW